MSNMFQIATLSPGLLSPSIAVATNRAGGIGILDLEFVADSETAAKAIKRLNNTQVDFGVKLSSNDPASLAHVLSNLPERVRTVVLIPSLSGELSKNVQFLRKKRITTLVEAICIEEARFAESIGVDGIIAKGHEAGGRVADETTFILLQRFLSAFRLPVWAYGGIGLHTVAACAAAGAAGVVLDSQLALTRESPLAESIKKKIAGMDGSETICLGQQLGESYRIYFRPGHPAVKALQETEMRLTRDDRPAHETMANWRQAIAEQAGWESDRNALFLGQDAAFAAPLAESFRTVGGVLQGMRTAIQTHCEAAVRLRPLAEGSSLARSHGTRYPILQGPMTRVSDVPEFAGRVAEEGALPFLALALLRGPEVRELLAEAQRRLGALSWGVGILGFVPPELRQEQLNIVREYRPPFALIAGGRPDQARELEEQGISTYLHVPSPGLLQMFVQQGARRFVFEGRECGGHVGPRTSFVLWNQMVDVLLGASELKAKPEEFHIVFAAGIHDALSASMVSVLAAPLAAQGVRIGVLVGSAYLFTKEAVTGGAILETFQEQAGQCLQTVLLETGPGHATRCVATPFAVAFAQEKRRLSKSGLSAEEIRLSLEDLNLGRLRIASKGVTRHPHFGQDPTAPKLMEVDKSEQVAQGMYMIGQVAALRNTIGTVQALHHEIAVESSARLEGLAERIWEDPPTVRPGSSSDVAVIGMACLLPKAPDLQTFWDNVIHKVDAVTEVPEERWSTSLYFDSDPKTKDKIYSKWGGFLEDVPFDPMQYGMPPASLRSIEPSQLLTLEVVRAALKDAGYLERPFPRERTSVILGAGGGAADLGLSYGARSFIPVLETLPEFQGRTQEILHRLGGRLPEWTEDSFAGILTNVSAGRVANRFDLGGSNYTVDAACASSLAAVSLALNELESRTSDMVVVGGIDTMQNPFTYLCFSKTQALSPRGRCRTFDESADGIAISEGIAMMVFKRLEDAERDGDHIYAVIKGAGSSSDGKDRGLTAPRPEGQARALKRAYAKAGVSPATVGLVEAHGTGTVAGDGAEVQALTQVFSEAQAEKQSCAIGSVKSMIGHTKCTAGAIGLVKTALALHHKILPPTIGVQKPNPRARFPETPFFVNSEPRPWLENLNGDPRRAGVSAFGFGGTNFHIVLEEYIGDSFSSRAASFRQWSDELFLWKAQSRQDLLRDIEAWEKALSADAKPLLRDLAFTAWKQVSDKKSTSDSPFLHLTIVASSLDDLKQKLSWAKQSLVQPGTIRLNDPRGIYFSEQPLAPHGKIAFLFPGQGSQYPNMLQDLLIHFPEMQPVFEQAVQVLRKQLDQPLGAYVFPPPSFSPEEAEARQKALTQTNIAQPALGAAGLAMFGLLKKFGLQPDMMAGHSYGEYIALAAAGVFSTETLIALSEARGRYIVEGAAGEPGTMAAIEAEAGAVVGVLKDVEGVCIANANAPRQTVISGTRAAVESAVTKFTSQGTTARTIPVACAFHSPLVAPAQERLAQFLSTVRMAQPAVAVYSNTTGKPYPAEPEAIAARLVEHLVRPVEFVQEIEAMYDAGARIFVEVGPRSVLTGLADKILGDRPKLAAASNQSARPGLTQLLHLLGQLAAQGVGLTLDRLYEGRSDRRLNLSALPQENGREALAPSVWMVNGARAKPLKEVAAPNARKETSKVVAMTIQNGHAERVIPHSVPPTAAPPVGASVISNPVSAATTKPIPPLPAIAAPSVVPVMHVSSVSPDGVPQVMAQFQQTMMQFLETQRNVMLAYLGAESSAFAMDAGVETNAIPSYLPYGAAEQPTETSPQATVFPEMTPVQQQPLKQPEVVVLPQPVHAAAIAVTAEIPAIVPSEPSAGPDVSELTARLLSIVSERTGYPMEMLDLHLDLEADLGIDSIKRVEILGTFGQSFAGASSGLQEVSMEKLTGMRTLQGIVDGIAEQFSAQPAKKVFHQSTTVGEVAEKITAQAHPAATSGLDKEALTARLLAIVSERTGYPTEMLDLDLDLEADLGVDSIKRVEILGNFQQSFMEAGLSSREGGMEHLTGIRTLRGIIDRIAESTGSQLKPEVTKAVFVEEFSKPTSTTSPANHQRVEEQIGRFSTVVVEAPLTGRLRNLLKERIILITEDAYGVASVLAGRLRAENYRVALVRSGQNVLESEPSRYTADLTSPEAAKELIALVHRSQGPLGGIIHLMALQGRGASLSTLDYQGWRERTQLGTKSLFYLAKAAGKHLREAGIGQETSFMAVTGMGGAFMNDSFTTYSGMNGATQFPEQGGVAGFMKTLALEWPEVWVKAVDLNVQLSTQALAGYLFDELTKGDKCVEVGYHGDKRVTIEPNPAPLNISAVPKITMDQSSVILITGGARGITALAASYFAERYRPTFVLVGRSPLPESEESAETAEITSPKELKAALMEQLRGRGEAVTPARVELAYARLLAEREVRRNLSALRKSGSPVHYHSLDVRDPKAFGELIDGIYHSFGRLDGVVHGAGVIEDKLIEDKTPESFDRVFDTKVDSAFILAQKLRPNSLHFLVLFSSVAGRFGNRGQGDYAAANEVLNKLAVCLDRAWPGRVVAINWGPWDSDGMVSAEVRKQFAERGVELIPPQTGLRRLEEELNFGCRGEAEVVIGGGGWQSVRRNAPHQAWPLIGLTTSSRNEGLYEFVREFDPAQDLYLQDHLIDGHPVLPLAIATELIAEAVAQGWPEMQVAAVRDLRLLQGITFEHGPQSIRVVAKPGSIITAEVGSVAVEVFGSKQPHRARYRATVELARRLPDVVPPEPTLLTDGHPFLMPIKELYQQWLFHGPLLQGIKQVERVGMGGIRAVLATSSPTELLAGSHHGSWLVDPLMFDSALQLLVLWAREHWDMTALPSGFGSYRRFGHPLSREIFCEMRIRPNTGGQNIHADIFFKDTGNRIVAVLEDMQGACSKALNRLAGEQSVLAVGTGS